MSNMVLITYKNEVSRHLLCERECNAIGTSQALKKEVAYARSAIEEPTVPAPDEMATKGHKRAFGMIVSDDSN